MTWGTTDFSRETPVKSSRDLYPVNVILLTIFGRKADTMTDKVFIQEALRIANKGIQINDGHQYMVPAHDLVEYAETIKALVVALEDEWRAGHAAGYELGYSEGTSDEENPDQL